ncbi:MAG: DUF927 domain-containing protein [Rickettsiales bacterium]|jgi:putative DNA primase/helicase|nr:DUF927 domain-containing protein [Rickettsiales bacterium]
MELLNEALSAHSIPLPNSIVGSNNFTRWGKNNCYWARELYDGYVFGDWAEGISEKVFPRRKDEYSKKEWGKRMKEFKRIGEEEEKDRVKLQEETSEKALAIWNSLPIASADHPYLQRKKVKPIGLKYDIKSKKVVAPLRDSDGKLWSLQYIGEDGSKLFMQDGRTGSCYFSIGKPGDRIIVCEGVATGLSIYKAIEEAVAVAFCKNNLYRVVEALKNKFPDKEIIIAADNDLKEGDSSNVGVEEAKRVADRYGCAVVIPELKGGGRCDFNDLMITEGVEAVRKCFEGPHSVVLIPNDSPPPPNGFMLKKGGLYYDDGENNPLFISSPIEVIAKTRNKNGENWGLRLKFKDYEGIEKQISIPLTAFAGDCRGLWECLLDAGLFIASGSRARSRLKDYLYTYRVAAEYARSVRETGWYGDVFVLPDDIIGTSKEMIYFQSDDHIITNHYRTKGTIEDWRENIAKPCQGNSRLIFALCTAFGSPLLTLLDLESCGFHLVGKSSCGKSTILKVAASVFGGPDYIHSWRATSNGLEGAAFAHNDSLLVLDEIGQMNLIEANEIVYTLGNGRGKLRANKSGYLAKNNYNWRLLFLSSGEVDLATHMNEAKKIVRAGQEIRLLNIPAEPGENSFGAFETIHDFQDGGEFSQYFCRKVIEYYGTPSRKFIEKLMEIGKERIKIKFVEYSTKLKSRLAHQNSREQVGRALGYFILLGFAGELATEFGITGWNSGETTEAVIKCFEDWLEYRGGANNQEEKAILEQVKYFFERFGESRFRDLDDKSSDKINDMAGYRETIEKTDNCGKSAKIAIYYVFPGVLKKKICFGHNFREAKKILHKKGWLENPGADGKRAAGEEKPKRLYVFYSEKIFDYQLTL